MRGWRGRSVGAVRGSEGVEGAVRGGGAVRGWRGQ